MILETLAKAENRAPDALLQGGACISSYVRARSPEEEAEMHSKKLEEEKRYREQEWAKIGAFFAVRLFADTIQRPDFNLEDKESAWETCLKKGESLVEKAMLFNIQPYEFIHFFRPN